MAPHEHDNAPQSHAAVMVRSHRFNLIWILPLVAAIATAWLGWRSYANRGPEVTILLDNAAGIEAGRTQIKYKNVPMGTVETVTPTDDLSHVIVIARMGKVAERFLKEGAYFWVVKPSLSAKDVSGLGTFISGAYLEFEPGNGKDKRDFIGEQTPKYIPPEEPGTVYSLHTAQLGSIGQGALLYYHGIKVGKVLGYDIADTGELNVRVFVDAAHTSLVHTGTRFWNTSGVSVMVGSNGLKVQLNSIESLLTGGIAFDVPPDTEPGALADATASFTLYPDESTADDSVYTQRIHFLLHFTQAIPGLAVGSPVRLQGVVVGQISKLDINYDDTHHGLIMPVVIEIESERLKLPHDGSGNYEAIFRKLVLNGLRARMGSGNLLTGQKVIDLDMIAGAPAAKIIDGGSYPELPVTDANDVDSIMTSTKALLGKLQTAADELDKTLKQAGTAISSDDGGGDLAGTLSEVKKTARSVRVLSDYLENHPEAVLNGKSAEEEQ